MDLRQLNAFLAVVDHGGFTAAARATHTVQSNISTHVARLERELATTLIDRATGRLTEEGDAVVARARRIQAELAALEADVSALQGAPRGTVRCGIIGTTARWLTPHLVQELGAEAPQLHLIVADGTTTSLVLRLLDGELDLAVVGTPVEDSEIRTVPLFDEDYVLVAPDDHPLVKLEVATVADLAQHELLLAAPRTPIRRELDDAFAAAGVRVKPKVEIDGLRLLASLAFAGFGAAIVPASAAPSWVGGSWTRIPVEGLPRRRVGLATRRRGMPSMAAQAVQGSIRHILATRGPQVGGLHVAA
jgi:LysR family hydrogen peroxide-inducible transcriptional activator